MNRHSLFNVRQILGSDVFAPLDYSFQHGYVHLGGPRVLLAVRRGIGYLDSGVFINFSALTFFFSSGSVTIVL